ncbi:MAG: hypothetical protein ACT4PT_04345 [Methanobacteriota archaeon]
MRRLLALALLAPALAGCVGPQPGANLESLGAPLEAARAFGYVCLAEERAPSAAPCLTDIALPDATVQEPFVALHPTNPSIMAVGVNLRRDPVRMLHDGYCGTGLGLFVTEDGGRTWRETIPPAPGTGTGPVPVVPACTQSPSVDPALLFDATGRLHFTGLTGRGVYYVYTDDLGRTWSPSTHLRQDGRQDRPFITLDAATGALYVVWWQHPTENWTTELAWSFDRGETWHTMDEEQLLPCASPGPVVRLGKELMLSCNPKDHPSRPLTYVFDPLTGTATLRSEILFEGVLPILVPLEPGRLALVALEGDSEGEGRDAEPMIYWSDDAGRTWSPPVALRAIVEGRWPRGAYIMWAEGDPFGNLHLLASLRDPTTEDSPVAALQRLVSPQTHEARHLVLDPAGRKVLETTLSTHNSRDDQVRTAQKYSDDIWSLAWGHDGMTMAFTVDGVVKLARAQPVGGDA